MKMALERIPCNYDYKSENLEIINSDSSSQALIDCVINLNDRELIVTGDKKLKKFILNNDMTQMNCSYTIELPDQRPGFGTVKKISDDSFLTYEQDFHQIDILSAHNGGILNTIQMPFQLLIYDVKHVNGILIILFQVDENPTSYDRRPIGLDIYLYSLEKKKFSDRCICMKEFGQNDNNELNFTTLGEQHFVTFYRHGDQSWVSVWKLDFMNVNEKTDLQTPLEKKYSVGFCNLVLNKFQHIVGFNSIKFGSYDEELGLRFKVLTFKADATMLFYPACNKPFVKFKLNNDMIDDAFYPDIRKYARVLAQAHRTNTGLFSTLPLELVIFVICKTRDRVSARDVTMLKTIVYKFFCKP
ncbi:hypothetical protein WDU94_003325 [Cyamophila willieti]